MIERASRPPLFFVKQLAERRLMLLRHFSFLLPVGNNLFWPGRANPLASQRLHRSHCTKSLLLPLGYHCFESVAQPPSYFLTSRDME